MMPLQRRMFGPSFCTRSCTHGKNLSGSERLVGRDRHRLHVLVVIVLQAAAMAVRMVVIVMVVVAGRGHDRVVAMVVIMIVVMVLAGLQEVRLELEDAVEIEGVAAEHLGERNVAALGLVHAWRRG